MLFAAVCWMAAGAVPARGGEAGARARSVLEGVAGLEKPVSFTETKIPLSELVQKVAEETGVALTAAREVADEPVAVVVRDLPARELLEQLAELLDYRWSRRGTSGRTGERASGREVGARAPTPNAQGPTPVFEIWQDLAGKQREEALRRASGAEVEQRFQEEVRRYVEIAGLADAAFQELITAYEKRREERARQASGQRAALPGTPEERERLRRAQAAVMLSSPIRRTLARLLGRLTPEQWTRLRAGRQLAFSTEPYAGELRLPADVASAFRASRPVRDPPAMHLTISDPALAERARAGEQEMQEQWAAAIGYRVTVRIGKTRSPSGGGIGISLVSMPLRRSPAALGPVASETGESLSVAAQAANPSGWQDEATPERRAALEQDPVLGARERFRPQTPPRTDLYGPNSRPSRRFRDLLPDLAHTFHVSFIADAYIGSDPYFPEFLLPTEPVALFTILDQYASPTQQWERHGNLIRLRNRTWFLKRPREIPLRLVRGWRGLFEQRGALTLEAYAEAAATLRDEQLESLRDAAQDTGLPLELGEAESAREALRVYAALSPSQRQALWHKQGVPMASLPAAQHAPFAAVAGSESRYPPTPPGRPLLASGRLTMQTTSKVRVREAGSPLTVFRDEAAPRGTQAAPAAPPGGRPDAQTRFPITQVMLHFYRDRDLIGSCRLTVATPVE